jgi:hypothetical protein
LVLTWMSHLARCTLTSPIGHASHMAVIMGSHSCLCHRRSWWGGVFMLLVRGLCMVVMALTVVIMLVIVFIWTSGLFYHLIPPRLMAIVLFTKVLDLLVTFVKTLLCNVIPLL